ncbi:signal-transducing adaptor protein 1-like [Salarias fasciatus]|uniref:Signal-transducing adaptor protein 1-like n=1 Tax=Salarias fasciatus TaxID=181472 RepID=A0A672I9K4_SALFA|nr:signal-transducing adaptor protein 1-like [Salarias fasciatus]
MAKRIGRERTQLPTCYYEGYLEKRSFKDKTSRKLWACLCGNSIFFFNEKRDVDYVEKLDLCGLVSVTDDSSQEKNLDAARFNLQMKEDNIKITAPNAEARELWKGFILSVAELHVPPSLNLLPGQLHMLNDAVEKEKERQKKLHSSPAAKFNPYISVRASMPACFHTVNRLEAELLLERAAKRGNVLLRPGSDGNFAVSTRQDYDGPLFRHYRVSRKTTGGFSIDVDNPVDCATLHDVITYLVNKTDGVLIPLILEDQYDKKISYISSDNENGEMSLQQAFVNPVPPDVPPRPDMLRTLTPEPEPMDRLDCCLDETNSDKKTKKLPLLPSAPRRLSIPSVPTTTDHRVIVTPESKRRMPAAALSELKMKLKAKCL